MFLVERQGQLVTRVDWPHAAAGINLRPTCFLHRGLQRLLLRKVSLTACTPGEYE